MANRFTLIIIIGIYQAFLNKAQYIPFDGFENCFITKDICPNENVSFFLYTSKHSEAPIQLNVDDPESILSAPFIFNRPIVILVHGYTGHRDFSPNKEIRNVYLSNEECNIISVDYHPLVVEPCYYQAVQNLRTVAKCLAQLIDFMVTESVVQLDSIHIIGFSLGAHTAGMTSNFIESGKLKRITGLDPAKPLFILAKGNHRLDQSDAEFVDIIHTDVLERGVLAPCGHADFYMNGGIEQPGCKAQQNISIGSCNHNRAPEYYAESIISSNGFWGFKCTDWIYWGLGICRPANSNELALMGFNASKDARGMFFINTNKEPPFAEGILPEFQIQSVGKDVE